MPRPTFYCSFTWGKTSLSPYTNHCQNKAAVLVMTQGQGIMYPACNEHVNNIIMDRFIENDRAKVNVRNARTWHVNKGG